jgi:tRNA pseudouridine38-40 synthase
LANFKLTLAYDGTGLVGWQRQASGVSVQGLLEDVLCVLDGRPVAVAGAGRTDAGVHALGQVASASLERGIDAAALVRALNAQLPRAVRVLDAIEAPANFHPRFAARSKTYRYRIWNAGVMSPFERAYAWHVAVPSLDVEAMATAAALLRGRHDFAAFQAAGPGPATTEREMFASAFLADPVLASVAGAALMTYEVSGSGFLRYMVRNIVGTLVEVGRGKRPPHWVSEVLASRNRAEAGQTAPAEGLFLVRVEYE